MIFFDTFLRTTKSAFSSSAAVQGCQIFLGTTYQNGKNTKLPPNVPNGHKIYQSAVNIPNGRKIFEHRSLSTQNGIFGLKMYHLATPRCCEKFANWILNSGKIHHTDIKKSVSNFFSGSVSHSRKHSGIS
jgi:hypothetical protein